MLGQRKHHTNVSYCHCNQFTLCNMPGYPASKELRQGQNPGLSESCCPPSFPYTTLPPTSQKGHFFLFCSLVICQCCSPHGQGPCLTHVCPFPLQIHTQREGPSRPEAPDPMPRGVARQCSAEIGLNILPEACCHLLAGMYWYTA